MIPDNVFGAASSGSVLPVVFFCVVAGLALGSLRSVHENLGRERQGGGLVVPLGITLNPQGNVLHFSIAAVFVAQLYGQSLAWEQIGVVVVASVLTSVAASGAPGVAALGMLTLVLEPLGLPAAVGLILLTAIDPIVDPLLTAANVHATCASATLIAEKDPAFRADRPVTQGALSTTDAT